MGLDTERRSLDPGRRQAGGFRLHGERWTTWTSQLRVPVRRRQHGHRRREERQRFRWGRVGLDEERWSLDTAGNQAGRLRCRGERSTRPIRVAFRRWQHGHRRREPRQRFSWGRVGLDAER